MNGHYEGLPALPLGGRPVCGHKKPAPEESGPKGPRPNNGSIPIVFPRRGRGLMALGLVADLAHPGGNATGVNFFAAEIDAKRLGLHAS